MAGAAAGAEGLPVQAELATDPPAVRTGRKAWLVVGGERDEAGEGAEGSLSASRRGPPRPP